MYLAFWVYHDVWIHQITGCLLLFVSTCRCSVVILLLLFYILKTIRAFWNNSSAQSFKKFYTERLILNQNEPFGISLPGWLRMHRDNTRRMVTHVSSKRQSEAAVVQDIKCRCCCSTNRFRIKFNYMQNTHGPSMCGWQL